MGLHCILSKMDLRAWKLRLGKWQIILCLPEDDHLLNYLQSWQGVNSSCLLRCFVPCHKLYVKLGESRLFPGYQPSFVWIPSRSHFRPLVHGQSNLSPLPGGRVEKQWRPYYLHWWKAHHAEILMLQDAGFFRKCLLAFPLNQCYRCIMRH